MLIRHIIDGREVESSSAEVLENINPATGKVFSELCSGGTAEVDMAAASAGKAFESWGRASFSERGAALRRLADLIEENAGRIGLAETRDTGKPIKNTVKGEVPLVASIFRYYAELAGKTRDTMYDGGKDFMIYSLSQPYGPVGVIIPWNYPFVIIGLKCAAALMAGNTLVIKPSKSTPLSAYEFGKLCIEAGLPPGTVNVIQGKGGITGDAITTHPKIKKISFTGSTEVGIEVMKKAAGTVKPVTLELGGKNPNIVFEDADLEMAAAGSVFTAYLNTGQICTSGSRLLVQESIYDRFIELLKNEAEKLVTGNPEDEKTDLGPMITKQQYDIVEKYCGEAQKDCNIIFEGNTKNCNPKGYFMPVRIFETHAGHKIAREEIFGPVLSVIKFRDEDEAVKTANDSPYGLASAFWTKDLARAIRLGRELESGFVWGNTVHALFPDVPYCGLKQSGMGQELGLEGLKNFMHKKCVYLYTGKDKLSLGSGGLAEK